MKTIRRNTITGLALVAIGVVAAPSIVLGFVLLGGVSLGISTSGNGYQRDVRVFNSFADSTANDNNVAETTHPGALGAPLAIWKGAQAWASDTFDAQINTTINKNFDPDWQGVSPSGSAGNTVSAADPLGACSGGVLAYTEPSSGGWRMSFCESWIWQDGPGIPGGSQIDIQGVTAHEYGHALGMDHSQSGNCPGTCGNNPTMCAFICGNGSSARTLAQDDVNGLAALYGAAPVNKPVIGSYTGSNTTGGALTILGSNFAATVNVKFTAGTTQNTGVIPGVVYNVPSANGGTSVTVAIPHEAVSGNVLVWEPALNLLSNAFPIPIDPCPTPTTFCVGNPNSFNPGGAQLSYTGSTFTSNNDFHLVSFGDIPPNKTCLAFYGMNTTINVAFGNGRRCIANPFFRVYPVRTSDLFGDVDYQIDLNTLPLGGQITPGQVWGFQMMYRDPAAGGALFNCTDGLITTWCL
ncbi:MAG TPA: matrixin family metalloprotease [Planctomycetota bacterium]|jgi:hypothetical protein|nr:matrixin family metalloprotease [Planctomycetota bacterium]